MRSVLYQVPLALAALVSARVLSMYPLLWRYQNPYTSYMTNIYLHSLAIDVEGDQVKLHNPLPQAFANCYWDGTTPFYAGSYDTRNG